MACFVLRDRPARSGAASHAVDVYYRTRQPKRHRPDSYTRATVRLLPMGRDEAGQHMRPFAPLQSRVKKLLALREGCFGVP